MKLEQATHILESNRAEMRMSIFTEEIPGQIAAGINRLGDGRYGESPLLSPPGFRVGFVGARFS